MWAALPHRQGSWNEGKEKWAEHQHLSLCVSSPQTDATCCLSLLLLCLPCSNAPALKSGVKVSPFFLNVPVGITKKINNMPDHRLYPVIPTLQYYQSNLFTQNPEQITPLFSILHGSLSYEGQSTKILNR